MQDWVFEAGVADSGAGMGAVLEPGLHDPNWLTNALKTDDLSLDGALFNPSFNNGDATDLDDVVSVGTRPPGPNFPGFPGNVEVNPGLTNDADSGGGGGGDEFITIQPVEPYDACQDRQADTLADDINDEIGRQPDNARREYGALIWRDDAGNLHRIALVPGSNGTVVFPPNSNDLGLDSYSRVVGMVHSHPSEVNLGTEASPNWVQASHGWIHGGDWQVADSWVGSYGLDINNFTMYISYQGVTRDYDYVDNLNPSIRASQTDSGSDRSGDYNPGEACP